MVWNVVSVSVVSGSSLNVNFEAAASDGGAPILSYLVERADNVAFTIGKVTVSSDLNTDVDDTGLTAGSEYYYRITASNAKTAAVGSVVGPFVPFGTPSAPASLSCSVASATGVTCGWSAPSSTGGAAVDMYNLQRATNSGFSAGLNNVVTALVTTHDNDGLSTGTQYWYRVRASNTGGGSYGPFATFGPIVPAGVPDAPGTFEVTDSTADSVSLSWNAAANNGEVVTNYRVEKAEDVGFTVGASVVIDADTLSVVAEGLTPGTLSLCWPRKFH